MPKFSRRLFLPVLFALSLAACDDDESITSTDAGTSNGDGGATSAQFSGVYSGKMDIQYQGDDVSGRSSFISSVTINKNGTVSMTVDGETIGGTISGNQVTINLRLTQTKDGVECEGNASVNASVVGNTLSGPVTGDATCQFLTIKQSATMTGSLTTNKKS